MPSAVLANSGGIDSRVSAAMLTAEGWTLHSVYLDWTHLPGNADAAAETARRYCASHEVVPWAMAGWVHDNARTRHPSLPWISRLAAMLTAVRGQTLGAEAIASGVRAESNADWSGFDAWMGAHKYRPAPRVLLPVFDLTTPAITAEGKALGVDLDSTWSCTASDPQCGTCTSCRRRVSQGIALHVGVMA